MKNSTKTVSTDTQLLNKPIDRTSSTRQIPNKVQIEMLATEYRGS